MTAEEFEAAYHNRWVIYTSPALRICGVCTAALKRDEYILAIMDAGYHPWSNPEKWVTFKCPLDDESFDKWITQFEAV